jgi:hypothetical protein
MHPEMVSRNRRWPDDPPERKKSPEELAAEAAREEGLQAAVHVVTPAVRRLFVAFIARMQTVPTIPIVDAASRTEEVKGWRLEPAFRHVGPPLGAGWFVPTRYVGRLGAPEHLGLAVAADGAVFETTSPNCFEIVAHASTNVAGLLAILAFHTHHTALWDAEMVSEMTDVLAELLAQAAAAPVGLAPRKTRREPKGGPRRRPA